jgi:hypothetical protein
MMMTTTTMTTLMEIAYNFALIQSALLYAVALKYELLHLYSQNERTK